MTYRCYRCKNFLNNDYLKCAVAPMIVASEESHDCQNFELSPLEIPIHKIASKCLERYVEGGCLDYYEEETGREYTDEEIKAQLEAGIPIMCEDYEKLEQCYLLPEEIETVTQKALEQYWH